MNILDNINRDATKIVKNPNYNPRAKKNKQPEFISVPDDSSYKNERAVNDITQAYTQGWQVPYEYVKPYEEYGINYRPGANLDLELAEAQPNTNKAWHALTQTVVSEIGLGTLRGVSDLVDFVVGGAIRTVTGEDNDYTNPVSETIKGWQEEFKNYQPIYQTPGVNIDNGGLTDFGWWMSNIPSIASSLTLLIPSTGLVKGVSWLGKATKLNKGIGNARKFLTNIEKVDRAADAGKELGTLGKVSQWINNENTVRKTNDMFAMGLNGFTSRVMENYQEANQVYQDILPELYNGNEQAGITGIKDMSDDEYNELINRNKDILSDVDTSDRSSVAKKLAKEAADRTFRIDMINGFFDVYELYGLRNMKRFMNAPMRASVRRKHLNSIKYAGKTKEEIEAIEKGRSMFSKAAEKTGDFLWGSKVAIGAQISEGVEEAINYIAQEEGLRYGHILLGTENENSFWDTRLIDYVKNPQLHDSAFWGLLGGITFQAAASGLARAKNAYDVKSAEAKYTPDEKTKEAVKKTPWSEAFEMPEVKRRIGNIEGRGTAYELLKAQLKQIKDEINPFEKNDDGTNKLLKTKEEKAVARDRAFNQRETNLLMDAMFVGNWDITRAYLESDEVRDALVASGVVSQEEAVQRQAQIKRKADMMEELYSRNLRAIGNAMRGTDKVTGANFSDIPTEYFQIIAAENMRHQLDADQFGRNIEAYTPIAGSEEKRLEKELAKNGIDYKETIRSFILAQQLGQIEAELQAAKKTLKEGRTKNNIDARTISGQTAIRELELRKRTLTNMIKESTNRQKWSTNNLAKLLVTLRASAATESNGKGGYRMNVKSDNYRKLDDAITKAFNAETEEDWEKASISLFDLVPEFETFRRVSQDQFKEAAYLADVFNENVARALGENGAIETLDNLSHKLLISYASVTHNEIAREIELAHIVKDRQSILTLAHAKHNDMNSLRGIALESALHVLKGIAKKYEEEFGDMSDNLAYGTLVDTARNELKNILTDDDMKTYDDAMRIIALNRRSVTRSGKDTSAINALLPEMVKDALYQSSRDEFEEVVEDDEAKDETEEKEKSSTSKNSISATENKQLNKTSQQVSKPNTKPASGQIVDFHIRKSGVKSEIPVASISVNNDNAPIKLNQYDNKHKDYTDVILIPVEGEENTYDLDFKGEVENDAKDGTEEVFTNPYFFNVKTPIINGGEVISNPRVVLNSDGTIAEFRPGTIANPESAEAQEEINNNEEQNAEKENSEKSKPAPTSSTGGREQDSSDNGVDASSFEEYDETSNEETTAAEQPYDTDNLNTDISQRMISFAKAKQLAGEEYDENEFYSSLQDEYKDKVSEEDLRTAFNSMKGFGKRIAKKLGLNIKEFNDLADFVDASALTDAALNADEAANAQRELEKAFNNIINNFAKRSVVETYNGKKVISLENLLRYANEIAGDNRMGEILYDKFVEIIRESGKYILVEGHRLNQNEIIDRASMSEEERFNAANTPNGRSIDFNYLLKNASKEDREKIYDIIDELKPDDEIDVVIRDSGKGIEFRKNNVAIGTIPISRITGTSYILNNRGWIVDIPKSNDGTKSKLEQLFIRLMINPDNEEKLKPIVAAIQKAMYTSSTIFDKDSGKKLSNPDYKKNYEAIIDAIKDAGINIDQYIDLSRNDEFDLASYMVNIYRGVKSASEQWISKAGLTVEEYNEAIKNRRIASIHNWFERLKDSCATAEALSRNSNLKVKIDTVNQGGLIITSREEAEPINAEGVIGSKHKGKLELIVASISEAGKLYSTNGTSMQMGAIRAGSTFVAIPRTYGEPALVHAYPQAIGASHLTGVMKEIEKEVLSEFDRLLSAWSDNVFMSSDDIANFINTLCSSNKGNNALFRGFKVTKLTRGFEGIQIEYFKDGRKQYIKLFDSHPRGGKASVIQFGKDKPTAFKEASRRKEVLSKFKEIVKETLTYNIEFDYVKGTNNLKGFAKRGTKGQFIIELPNGKKHTFNSFKDFIIDNGLVAVTTKSTNGKTNFYRPNTSNNQFDKTRVTFKIVDNSSIPVENRKQAAPVVAPIKKGDEVKQTIEKDGTTQDVGEKIINSILNGTQLNILKNSRIFRELSLGNIIFVDKIPGAIAAHFGKSRTINGVKIPAGVIAVTQQWIDMLNSDDKARHEEAVRHLIHESIHRRIDTLPKEEQRKLFDTIRGIFNEFVAANERDGVRDAFRPFEYNTKKKDEDRYYKDGEINDKGLEEFLVESITRPYLIKRLNEIATDGQKVTNRKIGNIKSKNLFQKILATIAKLFDLNINKGSLLEKEYKLFEQVGLTSTVEETKKDAKTKTEVAVKTSEKTTSNSAPRQLELDFDNTNSEEKEEPIKEEPKVATSVNAITMESAMNMDVDEDDVDESSISDTEVASLGQVRDTIIPENRETFESLVSKGAIQINC